MKKLKEIIERVYDTGKMPSKRYSLDGFRQLEHIYDELSTNKKCYFCFYTDMVIPTLKQCGISVREYHLGYLAEV